MSKESFEFNYSAKEQAEIKRIREKYLPREACEDKMAQLRRLDESVAQKAGTAALVVGVLGALVLGVGMCLCLVWEKYIPGSIIGVLGIAGVSAAYPLYQQITRKERARIAPEILRLTDELMK